MDNLSANVAFFCDEFPIRQRLEPVPLHFTTERRLMKRACRQLHTAVSVDFTAINVFYLRQRTKYNKFW
jgi:hypothetical protein